MATQRETWDCPCENGEPMCEGCAQEDMKTGGDAGHQADLCDQCIFHDKQMDNRVFVRVARLGIWVDRKWLLGDYADQSEEEDGWKEIFDEITRLVARHLDQGPTSYQVSLEEWEGSPEVETNAHVLRNLRRA